MSARRRGLAANARPFRYGFYPAVAVGFLLFGSPSVPQSAVVALWCGLWPLAADFVSRGGDARRSLRLHLVEVALSSLVFVASGLPQSLLAAICIILVMSNALQGGLKHALKSVVCGALGLAGGYWIAAPFDWPTPVSAFSMLLLLAYCMLVAHVAFDRVLTTHGDRVQTRALNERLQQYLPHTLAGRLGAAKRPRLERRWLVVVFADLAGFTALVERTQTEELAPMLDGYLRCVAGVTRRWSGAVSQVVGDGVLLVFGEEGGRSRKRLVADALGCCRELSGALGSLTMDWQRSGLPCSARVKIGIASGFCSLGDWGGDGRLEYTVIGHPVNLASRLQGLAATGETLVCERTALLAKVAKVPLSPPVRGHAKGLGEVPFRKVLPPSP